MGLYSRAAGRHPGPPAGADARRARRQRTPGRIAPGRRLRGLRPAHQAPVRGVHGPRRAGVSAADAAGSGRALRGLPLERRTARRRAAPRTISRSWRASPAASAGACGSTPSRRVGVSAGLPAAVAVADRRACTPTRWRKIHDQARLQVEGQRAGARALRAARSHAGREGGELEPNLGLLGLPEPSPGDLFFDIEGDPYALDDGVDYLFGVLEPGLLDDATASRPSMRSGRATTRATSRLAAREAGVRVS